MIVATAGHVDHGKTSLVKQLTGTDTDRLEEEKRRGLSINLGFAYRAVDESTTIGFVDVPGHTRFINTMISGVHGIDLALVVVAADDGAMPQTREHLDVLRLLGVSEYVLVITRIDLVESAAVDAVALQMKALLPAASPVFAVDNLSGTGIDALITFLEDYARSLGQRLDSGHFRLAIDRVFSIRGTGLVATGTALSGTVATGNQLQIQPGGRTVRVRGIHAQDEQADTARAGQRCAINIAGADSGHVKPGDWLQATELAPAHDRIDVRLALLPSVQFTIKHMTPVKLYIGARRVPARLYLLDKSGAGQSVTANDNVLAQLIISGQVACCHGDRFLLRDDSESFTLGGGQVLDPQAQRSARLRDVQLAWLAAMEAGSAELALKQLLLEQHRVVDLSGFRKAWNLSVKETDGLLARSSLAGAVKSFSSSSVDYWMAVEGWEAGKRRMLHFIRSWHSDNPRAAGAQPAALRRGLETEGESPLFEQLLSDLVRSRQLSLTGGLLALAGHTVTRSREESRHWRAIEKALEQHGRQIPALAELQSVLAVEEKVLTNYLRLAVKEGAVIQLGKRRFALPATMRTLAGSVNELAELNPQFSVVDVKSHIGLGRNLVVEILEYFDSIRFTVRQGSHRSIIDSTVPSRVFNGPVSQ